MTTGFLNHTVKVADSERPYVVYSPRSWDGKEKLPAILFLHGRGESGVDGIKQTAIGLGNALRFDAARWPYLVVFPQKCDMDAMWADDAPMLDAILRDVEKLYPHDATRRYITGLSQGGRGTFMLAKKLVWKFAAAAPVCGWASPDEVRDLVDMPLWAFHGLKDDVVKPEGTQAPLDWLIAHGAPAKMTLFPDANHNAWDPAYGGSGLWNWFLEHRT